MEESLKSWFETKVPTGHMWLQMTFSIRTDDDGGDFSIDMIPSRTNADAAIQAAGVGMSPELSDFIATCVGKVRVNKEKISLVFESEEDYVRFRLIGLSERDSILG